MTFPTFDAETEVDLLLKSLYRGSYKKSPESLLVRGVLIKDSNDFIVLKGASIGSVCGGIPELWVRKDLVGMIWAVPVEFQRILDKEKSEE